MSEEEVLLAYAQRFGELPDSRLMSSEAVRNFKELALKALDRGEKLTDEELGLSSVPPEVTV